MYILGISCYFHDSAAALLKDGVLIAASEEERFTRIKHDSSFPDKAVEFCLAEAGITPDDLDYIVFYEKPFKKFERLLMTTLSTFPQSLGVFREAMIAWFNEKLWVKGEIARKYPIPTKKILFVDHHLAHGASSFFASPYKDAAVVTLDGVGEWATTTISKATADWDGTSENKIDVLREIRFPHSLGLLYSAFTAFLGFRVNNGEYKVMGMAPYGFPKYKEDIYKVINFADDGSFNLDMDYFTFHRSLTRSFSNKFEDVFGPARKPESEFFCETTHPGKSHPDWDDAYAAQCQHYADIAASIQKVTEEAVLKIAEQAYQMTGSKNLCLAGGVALNSVANGRLARESSFENIYIQSAAGDSGGALGAALHVHHAVLGHRRTFVQEHSYWGASYSRDYIRNYLTENSIAFEEANSIDQQADWMATDLEAGKVISLYQGRAEWGPRALGNRSILADPRREAMKETVNVSIKFREPFRPFAPAILEEAAPDYFDDLGNATDNHLLRYMLSVYPISEDKQAVIPAVTHRGGTGRLQTVRSEWNPMYHAMIKEFGERTGVPVVLNTSFNLRGEPIVNTPENAFKTFSESGIEALYLENFVVRKK